MLEPNRHEPGIKYASRGEQAVAQCLKQFCPGWHPIEGETVQIPIGRKKIDFRIGEVFIEFHPIFVLRELKSSEAVNSFKNLLKNVKRHQKEQLIDLFKVELAAQYYARRKTLIEAHPQYAGMELIVTQSSSDIYRHVIRRFSDRSVKWLEFKREWER